MAEASAVYSLRWGDDGFAEGAKRASSEAENLAASLAKLKKAGKGASPNIKPKLDPKPAEAMQKFSLKTFLLSKALKVSEKDAAGFIEKGALPTGKALELAGSIAARAGTFIAGAAIAATVAVIALGAAAIYAVASFARYALGAADAARSTGLFMQAATGSKAGAAELAQSIAQMANATGLGKSKLSEMGLALARAGVAGNHLKNAFSAVAIATSAMGDAAGSKLSGIAQEAVKTGRIALSKEALLGTGVDLEDVADALAKKAGVSFARAKQAIQAGTVKVGAALQALDDAVKAKLGGIAKKQAIGLDVQMARLHDNIGALFAGLDIDPFLDALHDMLSIFDQSTFSGVALKGAMQGIAKPLIEGLTAVMPLAKAFFQGAIIGALDVAIAILKVRNYLRDAFKGSSVVSLTTALEAGKYAAYGLAIGLGLALAALGLVVVIGASLAALIVAPLLLVGYAVYKAYGAIKGAFGAAIEWLSGLDFGAIATGLIDGLVGGIKSGAGLVIDAIRGLGSGAMAALKGVLGIASPSKVFAGFGLNTAQGFAQGVDEGAGEAEASVQRLGMPAPAAAAPGAKAGGKNSVQIERVEITINGVKDAEQLKGDDFRTMLAEALERLLNGSGGPLQAPEAA